MVPLFIAEGSSWTSLYSQPLEEPSARFVEATKLLSQVASAPVFAFDVYDSDVFRYVLAEAGTKKDDYVSNPAGYGAGGRPSPRGGDRTTLAPYLTACVDRDSEALDRMLATGQLKRSVTREERDHRANIARRISELTRSSAPESKAELVRLRSESSSWYPRTGLEDRRDNAEELAVFLGRLLGLERARITNSWRLFMWSRAHPDQPRRADEVLDAGQID